MEFLEAISMHKYNECLKTKWKYMDCFEVDMCKLQRAERDCYVVEILKVDFRDFNIVLP